MLTNRKLCWSTFEEIVKPYLAGWRDRQTDRLIDRQTDRQIDGQRKLEQNLGIWTPKSLDGREVVSTVELKGYEILYFLFHAKEKLQIPRRDEDDEDEARQRMRKKWISRKRKREEQKKMTDKRRHRLRLPSFHFHPFVNNQMDEDGKWNPWNGVSYHFLQNIRRKETTDFHSAISVCAHISPSSFPLPLYLYTL